MYLIKQKKIQVPQFMKVSVFARPKKTSILTKEVAAKSKFVGGPKVSSGVGGSG